LKTVLRLAVALEVGSGLILIAAPSTFARLIFGSELPSPGPGVGRLAGFALLALCAACWPARESSSLDSAARGMLLFNVLAVVYLVYRGIRGGATGPLLWPAAVLPAAFTLAIARAWRRERRPLRSVPAVPPAATS